ncbi:hypothetical protein ACWEGQ_00170 [Streptomyces seoulensis]
MATRTSSKTSTAKKPGPRKTTKRATPKTSPVNTTLVDLRHPLPVRRHAIIGPLGAVEQAAIRAALAAAAAQLPIPVRAWNGPTARLADGTTITHTPAHTTTNQPPVFHAAIRCPNGAVHAYTIHTAADLDHARTLTAECRQTTLPAPATPVPNPAIRRLGDNPTARADQEQPKEHPQP